MALQLEEYLLADNACRTKTSHSETNFSLRNKISVLAVASESHHTSQTSCWHRGSIRILSSSRAWKRPWYMESSPSASWLCTAKEAPSMVNHRDFCSSLPGLDTEATFGFKPLLLLPLSRQAHRSGLPALCTDWGAVGEIFPNLFFSLPPRASKKLPQHRTTKIFFPT